MASFKRFYGWVRFMVAIAFGACVLLVSSAAHATWRELGVTHVAQCSLYAAQAYSLARHVGGASEEDALDLAGDVSLECSTELREYASALYQMRHAHDGEGY